MRQRAFWGLGFAVLLGLAVPLGLTVVTPAHASISIAVVFDDLVRVTRAAVIATPVEQRAVWEEDRIITYTRCHVDEAIAGELKSGSEVWIATLGGRIDKIAQRVDGEPTFYIGSPTLLFLRADVAPKTSSPVAGIYIVTARAQGQYRVDGDAKAVERKLSASNAVGMLLPPKAASSSGGLSPKSTAGLHLPLAYETIHGHALSEVTSAIKAAWSRTHAP